MNLLIRIRLWEAATEVGLGHPWPGRFTNSCPRRRGREIQGETSTDPFNVAAKLVHRPGEGVQFIRIRFLHSSLPEARELLAARCMVPNEHSAIAECGRLSICPSVSYKNNSTYPSARMICARANGIACFTNPPKLSGMPCL